MSNAHDVGRDPSIQREVDPELPLTTLWLNRPRVANALRSQDCYSVIRLLEESLDSRVVVIRGRGAGFCSGADLHEILSEVDAVRSRATHAWTSLLTAVVQFPGVVMTAVHGYAVGGGHHLLMAGDIAILSTDAWGKVTGLDVGIPPMELGTLLLSSSVGLRRAKSMVLNAALYTADEALAMGLCAAVVSRPDFDSCVHGEASRLAQAGIGDAQRVAKAMLNCRTFADMGILGLSTAASAISLGLPEVRESVQSRLQINKGGSYA